MYCMDIGSPDGPRPGTPGIPGHRHHPKPIHSKLQAKHRHPSIQLNCLITAHNITLEKAKQLHWGDNWNWGEGKMLRLLVPCRSWVSSRMTARNLTTSAWKVCCNRFFMWSFIKVSMMITSLLLSAARVVQRFNWTPYLDNRCWWPSISGVC